MEKVKGRLASAPRHITEVQLAERFGGGGAGRKAAASPAGVLHAAAMKFVRENGVAVALACIRNPLPLLPAPLAPPAPPAPANRAGGSGSASSSASASAPASCPPS
jgi:hypothetical protein